MKSLSRLIIVIFILIAIPAAGYFVMESSGATVDTTDQKVVYDLPYPGLLSDNPLYFVKIVRDRITEFLTRDNLKKAQLYLLYSDKRAAMALTLSQKGKNSQAVEAMSKAEKYFLKIAPILKEAKTQGTSPDSSFVEILKLSNAKHGELIDELMKTLPTGFDESLKQLEMLNLQVKKDLESL